MNQVSDILALADAALTDNIDAVLATVVRTEGSAYRRPGAMMLICEDGRSVGMVSGGCLEHHLIQRAFWLTQNGPCVQVYRTGSAQDRQSTAQALSDPLQALFLDEPAPDSPVDDTESMTADETYDDADDSMNFGLGCHGSVHVLFERMAQAQPFLTTIKEVRAKQHPIGIATLLKAASLEADAHQVDIPFPKSRLSTCGLRLNLAATPNSSTTSSSITSSSTTELSDDIKLLGTGLEASCLEVIPQLQAAVEALSLQSGAKGRYQHVCYNDGNTSYEWLVQYLMPPIHLLICGAGNDAIPLVRMAKMLDWRVSVIDSRTNYATRSRFIDADLVQVVGLEDTETLRQLSKNAAVALMSHSLTQDRARLKTLLQLPVDHLAYLGQLGPRYRTERLINEIAQALPDPTVLRGAIAKLHFPIGYKLGGDGPEALALGIIAQISAVMYQQEPINSPAPLTDSLFVTV